MSFPVLACTGRSEGFWGYGPGPAGPPSLANPHVATSILYPNGGTRQGRSPRKGLGLPGPPSPHFYRRAQASPALPIPHFYRQGPGQPGTPNPSLLSTGPSQASPSLLLANPSFLLVRPGCVKLSRAVSAHDRLGQVNLDCAAASAWH